MWHIVVAARGRRPPRIGDADILVRYLEAQNHAGQPAWVEWSEQNPQLAQALWPAIGRLAQEELYVFVPDFFELARATTDPVLLQKSLNENLAEHLFQLAKRLQQREEQAEAKHLLDEAARLDTNNPLIKREREMAGTRSPPAVKK